MKLPAEQKAIRDKCFHPSGAFTEIGPEEIEQAASQRFEKIVRRFPDRLALKTRNCQLSYRQLNGAANRIARSVLAMHGEKSEPVALMFEQGVTAIVSMLAVLKTGKFYVPLDPAAPKSRCNAILADSTAGLLLTNTENFAIAEGAATNNCKVMNVDDLGEQLIADDPKISISPDALAYIVYTSGSTGEPKGVAQTHRCALYHVFEYGNSFRLSPNDRVSLIFPWTFNGGIHLVHSTLLNGAALFPFDVKADGLMGLARMLVEEKITIYHSTATTLREMLGLLTRDERFPSLRLVRFGGDSVTETDIQLYKDNFSDDCLLLNSLASTEAGAICRYFFDKETTIADGKVPAGYPAYGKKIVLLDEDRNEVGLDQIGEIAVKSRYLSAGYWRQPTLTAAKFITDRYDGDEKLYLTGDLGRMTPDGCLYHLGRKDFQVKIRGFRVDMSEVETALLRHDQVKEVAVVGRSDQPGNGRLVAYFVPADSKVVDVNMLRSFLSEKLPDYMIPASFVALENLPLTPNGKVNRRLLPDPGRARPDLGTPMTAPGNEVEKALVQIWTQVLAVDGIGIHDNFFALGGDSLSASRIVSAVLQRFQLDIPLKALMESPTVAKMAVVIIEHQGRYLGDDKLESILNELDLLSDEDASRLRTEERFKDRKN
jgi:amino acid adenylation domain-containing protein